MREFLAGLWAKCCDYAKKGYALASAFASVASVLAMQWACSALCATKKFCAVAYPAAKQFGSSCYNVACTAAGKVYGCLAAVGTHFASHTVQNVLHFSSGNLVLGFGKHEIQIQCEESPVKVSVSIQEPADGQPICQGGDVNSIGVKILPDGFILVADIKSNTCCVEWVCEF